MISEKCYNKCNCFKIQKCKLIIFLILCMLSNNKEWDFYHILSSVPVVAPQEKWWGFIGLFSDFWVAQQSCCASLQAVQQRKHSNVDYDNHHLRNKLWVVHLFCSFVSYSNSPGGVRVIVLAQPCTSVDSDIINCKCLWSIISQQMLLRQLNKAFFFVEIPKNARAPMLPAPHSWHVPWLLRQRDMIFSLRVWSFIGMTSDMKTGWTTGGWGCWQGGDCLSYGHNLRQRNLFCVRVQVL